MVAYILSFNLKDRNYAVFHSIYSHFYDIAIFSFSWAS